MKQEKLNSNKCIIVLFLLLVCSIILNFMQGNCIDDLIRQIRCLEHSYPITHYEEIPDTEKYDSTKFSVW
jgi:hypothetical protein